MTIHARMSLKPIKWQSFGDEIKETRAETHCGLTTSPDVTTIRPDQVTCEGCLRGIIRRAGVQDTRNVTK